METSKKIFILFISFLVVACAIFLGINFTNLFTKQVYVKNIICSESCFTVYQDECILNFLNNFVLEPSNTNQKIEFITSNNSKILVDLRTYKIKGLSVGNDTLTIKVKSAKNNYITKTININILPKRIFATSIAFEKQSVNLKQNETANNKLLVGGVSVNVLPTISYSNNDIISYDYITGNISALQIGSTTVTAIINTSINEVLSVSFNVEVSNLINENIEINASLIEVSNPYANTKLLRLNYELIKDDIRCENQEIEIDIIENTVGAIVEEDEYMTMLFLYNNNSGKLKLKLTSKLNAEYEKYVEIII